MFEKNHLYLDIDTNKILIYDDFEMDMFFFKDIDTGLICVFLTEELINEHILEEY